MPNRTSARSASNVLCDSKLSCAAASSVFGVEKSVTRVCKNVFKVVFPPFVPRRRCVLPLPFIIRLPARTPTTMI